MPKAFIPSNFPGMPHPKLPLAILFLCAPLFATPVFYTFKGEVTSSNNPDFDLGREVTYVFMADLEEDGYLLTNGVKSTSWYDFTDAKGNADYFHSEYIGGDAMANDIPTDWNAGVSYHIGLNDNRGISNNEVQLNGSNADQSGFDYISIFQPTHRLDQFFVGMDDNRVTNAVSNGTFYFEVLAQTTLVDISNENPMTPPAVPEPGSLALFGMGIAAVGFLGLRRPAIS
jgi:hypothetical protein